VIYENSSIAGAGAGSSVKDKIGGLFD